MFSRHAAPILLTNARIIDPSRDLGLAGDVADRDGRDPRYRSAASGRRGRCRKAPRCVRTAAAGSWRRAWSTCAPSCASSARRILRDLRVDKPARGG